MMIDIRYTATMVLAIALLMAGTPAIGTNGADAPQIDLIGGIDSGLDCTLWESPMWTWGDRCVPVLVHFDDEDLEITADVSDGIEFDWYWDYSIDARSMMLIGGPEGTSEQPASIPAEDLDPESRSSGWYTYFLTYNATNEHDAMEEYLEVRILPASLRPTAVISVPDDDNKISYPFELNGDDSTIPGDGDDPRFEWMQNGGTAGDTSVFTVDIDGLSHGDTVELMLNVVDGGTFHGDIPGVSALVNLELDLSPAFSSSLASSEDLGSTISPTVNLQFPDNLDANDVSYAWELDSESVGTSQELVLDPDDFAIGDVIELMITVTDGGLSETAEHQVSVVPPVLADQSTSADSLVTAATDVAYTFGFNLTDDWPADGVFAIGFPTGFSLDDPTGSISGCDGSATTSFEDRDVIVSRSGDATPCSKETEVEVTITGVVNRPTAGSTGGFPATLQDADENPLMRANFPSVTLTAPQTEEEDEEDTPDPLRPERVTDLQVVTGETSQDSVTLEWTTPEAHGKPLAGYRIGASKNTITTANFAQSLTTQVSFEPESLVDEGQVQRAVVSGLDADTVYHFAIQAEDEGGNRSQVSNVANTRTEALFDPVHANLELQATVSVRSVDGGMEVSWDPAKVPDIAAGIIIWRVNSPAAFAGIAEPQDPAFLDARFVDPEGNQDSGYLLTLYYGPQQDQGYNTESLAQIASFLGTTEDNMFDWGVARAEGSDSPGGLVILVLAILFLVVLGAIAIGLFFWIRRERNTRLAQEQMALEASGESDELSWGERGRPRIAPQGGLTGDQDDDSWAPEPPSGPTATAARGAPIDSPFQADDWDHEETQSEPSSHSGTLRPLRTGDTSPGAHGRKDNGPASSPTDWPARDEPLDPR